MIRREALEFLLGAVEVPMKLHQVLNERDVVAMKRLHRVEKELCNGSDIGRLAKCLLGHLNSRVLVIPEFISNTIKEIPVDFFDHFRFDENNPYKFNEDIIESQSEIVRSVVEHFLGCVLDHRAQLSSVHVSFDTGSEEPEGLGP